MSAARIIDHDGLFKDLFREFFADFLKAFFPAIFQYLDLNQLEFLQQELIIKPGNHPKTRVDLVVKVRAKGEAEKEPILIHIENQMKKEKDFAKRMFRYFQRLNFKEKLPIIPIAVLAYDHLPQEEESDQYSLSFPFGEVLRYGFFKIELKKLRWQDYLNSNNPVALALMGKMAYTKAEQVQMKLQFLTRIVKLDLTPKQLEKLVGFFETYVKLTEEETQQLQGELRKLESEEVSVVQRMITSWEERGRKEGIVKGESQGQIKVLLFQLKERFGSVPPEVERKFQGLPSEKLLTLSGKLLEVSSLDEFSKFLH